MTITILLALLLLLVLATIFVFYRYPLDLIVLAQRRALRCAGMRRHILRGPRGNVVYWKGGSGPVTFLLHGVNDQAGSWSAAARELIGDATLVIPDFPGHGESEPRSGELSLDDVFAPLDAIVDKEAGGGKIRLVGNSMGGWVALLYTLRHPGRVESLVLEASGGARFDFDPATFVPRNRDEAAKTLRDVYGPDLPMPAGFVLDQMIRRAPSMPAARIFVRDINEHALNERFGEITVPAMLIWGEFDAVLPLDYGRNLQSMIPGSRLEIIPRAGHIPHRTHPKQFADAARRALATRGEA